MIYQKDILLLNNTEVSSNITKRLRDAYSAPAMNHYYHDKYNWTKSTVIRSIHSHRDLGKPPCNLLMVGFLYLDDQACHI
jgi:hypothetical protein